MTPWHCRECGKMFPESEMMVCINAAAEHFKQEHENFGQSDMFLEEGTFEYARGKQAPILDGTEGI